MHIVTSTLLDVEDRVIDLARPESVQELLPEKVDRSELVA
jgi:hypothetical protein